MPKHRAKENCFIDNCYRREGEVFEYSGKPCPVLESLEVAPEAENDQQDGGPRLRRKSKAASE